MRCSFLPSNSRSPTFDRHRIEVAFCGMIFLCQGKPRLREPYE